MPNTYRWIIPAKTEPPNRDAERTTPDKWLGSTGEPVLRKVGTVAPFALATAFLVPQAPEAVSIDRWAGHLGRIVRPLIPGRATFYTDARSMTFAEMSSIDRWLGDLGRVVRRKTPGRFSFDTDYRSLTFPESPLMDKWTGNLGRVVRRLMPGRFSYDIDPRQLTQAETSSIDRWLGDPGRVVYRLKPGRFDFIIDPRSLTFAESSFLDKWIGNPGRVVRPLTGGKSFADLLRVDVEELTVDKWLESFGRRLPLPLQPTRDRFAYDLTHSQFESLTLDKWLESFAAGKAYRQPVRPWFEIDHRALTFAETVSVDRWIESFGRRLPLPLQPMRDRFIYDILFAHLEPMTMDKWTGSYAAGRAYRQPVRPWFTVDSRVLTTSEVITIDKWLYSLGRRLPIPEQPTRDLSEFDRTFAQFETLTSDKWTGSFAAGHAPLQPTRPRFDIDATQLTRGEASQLDKWLGDLGRVVRELKPGLGYFSIDAAQLTRQEFITFDKFGPSSVVARNAVPPTRPRFDIDASQLSAAETAQIDKWVGDIGRIVRRVPGVRGDVYFVKVPDFNESITAAFLDAYPEFARLRKTRGNSFNIIDAQSLTAQESITMDKWFRDSSIVPARSIGAPHPKRQWYAPEFTSILVLFNLPDVYNTSTVPAVFDKSTVAVVVLRSTLPVNPHTTEKP